MRIQCTILNSNTFSMKIEFPLYFMMLFLACQYLIFSSCQYPNPLYAYKYQIYYISFILVLELLFRYIIMISINFTYFSGPFLDYRHQIYPLTFYPMAKALCDIFKLHIDQNQYCYTLSSIAYIILTSSIGCSIVFLLHWYLNLSFEYNFTLGTIFNVNLVAKSLLTSSICISLPYLLHQS